MSDPTVPPRRPGGPMVSRPLQFMWLIDGSGSMRVDGKIQALNQALREALPYMANVARENPQASVYVRALRFADHARWIRDRPASVADFRWNEVEAGGLTALGEALTKVAEVLEPSLMTQRAFPPIIALVTDGLPTDDFQAGLEELMERPWGQRALRIVVAMGQDAAANEAQKVFRAFIGNDRLRPFQANSPETLEAQIRWICTAVLTAVVAPATHLPDAQAEEAGSDPTAFLPLLIGRNLASPEEAHVW